MLWYINIKATILRATEFWTDWTLLTSFRKWRPFLKENWPVKVKLNLYDFHKLGEKMRWKKKEDLLDRLNQVPFWYQLLRANFTTVPLDSRGRFVCILLSIAEYTWYNSLHKFEWEIYVWFDTRSEMHHSNIYLRLRYECFAWKWWYKFVDVYK